MNYNTKAYVLDNEKRRVPVGAVGELCLAGIQIADGYLNREEETKESFIANPFDNGEDYNVLYRTGDMVRILPDGTLGIVGRRDSQVKIRGNRVELSEVEAVIRELDYIEDITVQTIKHDDNYELVAYVVSDGFDEDTLRNNICEYVGEFKPDYMVPSHVINLDRIPLNVNGKVNKRELPEVDFDGLQVEYVAPTTQAEREIVDAFEIGKYYMPYNESSTTSYYKKLLTALDENDMGIEEAVVDSISKDIKFATEQNPRTVDVERVKPHLHLDCLL